MNDIQLIEILRQICGDKTAIGYSVDVDGVQVPNFVGTDHKTEIPSIVITPFISKAEIITGDVLCGEDPNEVMSTLKFNHARFQIDIYSKNLIQLLKIKTKIEERIEDFTEAELIVFKDNIGWEPYDINTYVNDYYDLTSPLTKIIEPLTILDKYEEPEDVTANNGSWCLTADGLYVNPLNDIEDVQIFQLLNGLVLPSGNTIYDEGIHTFDPLQSRKMGDDDPQVERWSMDYMISYRTLRQRNLGEKVEEIELDVEEN